MEPTPTERPTDGLPVRSQFLTLLCVLTFIGSALSLFDAVISLVQTDAVVETPRVERKYTPEQQKEIPKQYFEDRSSGDENIPTDPDRIRLLAGAQFPYALLTLVGAVFMLRQRRIGFWIYVVGVVTGLVLPVILVGFGALNTSFGVFFSMLFVGLYWLNLKDMH
ncbi:hypothetical protein [Spirosoma utsteinense]|uniref:DUF4386 domain-containing protein n=1 Tax=Spirosoma utsteinense TaxID=2585773 RepID=A0ABR6W2Y7_9BACT|nr:hypothetical protein [Spirosoma utsteinense]MBC3784236.1 hypothetical protein [Spirosoma utsteinense]MBC3790966.1 hypothetical protein [Spirosoma utsteinense]